jgi:hypothetical protein
MRHVVFRSLAGLLAVLIVLAIIAGHPPLRQLVGYIVLAVLFAAFALFGNGAADSILAALFGGPKPPPGEPD